MTKRERENAIRCLKLWMEREPQLQTYKTCLEALEQQPTVTSTNNSGEMTYPQVEGITPIVVNEDIYECSCGFGWDKNKTSRFHFCPNCGKAVGDGNDYKYIKSISKPTGVKFDIDIPKKVESYGKLLKHPVVKHVMGMDEEQLSSGDAVSRQAAIDANCYNCSIKANGGKCSKCDVVKTIEKLPSVNPQEKTGYWTRELIRNEKGGCIGAKMICSKCGNDNKHDEYMDYCPNCGVKMVKTQKDKSKTEFWWNVIGGQREDL